MTKTIKCNNCGANMNVDTDNAMRFCPYCGNAIKLPENFIDLAKFQAKHSEEVRQRIVKERREERKMDNKSTAIIIAGFILLLSVIGYLIWRVDPDMKCERLVDKVQQLIIEQDFDNALLEAQKIRVNKEGLFDSRYDRWENERKDLIQLIEQKKKEFEK